MIFVLKNYIKPKFSCIVPQVTSEGKCYPLTINRGNNFSHNLFVDDIMIFAMLCRQTWMNLHEILENFQKATGLRINGVKSSFHHGDVNLEVIEYLTHLFNIQAKSIKEGMKYLGYHLKPIGFSKSDWTWDLNRFYKRIVGWEYKCLSLAGRMILTQSVLAQLLVYWAHLFYILANIIHNLNILSAYFIWGPVRKKENFTCPSFQTLPSQRIWGVGVSWIFVNLVLPCCLNHYGEM